MINLDKINTPAGANNSNFSKTLKLLGENQKIIHILFFVGTLLVAWGIFKDYRTKETALRARMAQEQGKLGVIQSRQAAIQEVSNFKSSLPTELSVFDLITLVSNEARSHNTKIVSYAPNQSKDMGLYDAINVSFTVESDNFKDMMRFLRKIEKSNSPIVVNTWSGHQENEKILFTMTISIVHIHLT